jgi:hypothetical protein
MFGEIEVSVEPLIGWGVYEVTVVDSETDEPSPSSATSSVACSLTNRKPNPCSTVGTLSAT